VGRGSLATAADRGHEIGKGNRRAGRAGKDWEQVAMTPKTKTTRAKRAARESAQPKAGPRVIRKYPNRRLYDTVESRYVTLADIRRLVVERVDFVVLDRKTQQDITRSILLQVIAEQEGAGEALMSRDFLSQVIRSYGSGLQEFVGRYLDESIQLFAREQRDLRDKFKNVVGIDPLETVTNVAQKNYQRWKALQEEVFSRLPGSWGRGEKDD
jgi:polyhydroxyalkanoate synthesis repressor PhaR